MQRNFAKSLILAMGLTGLVCSSTFAQTYIFQDLGTLGGKYSFATAINDQGEAVGLAQNSRGLLEPFYYRNGSMIGLGILGFSQGQAASINNRSDILITAPVGTRMRSYLVQDGSVIDLGTLGGLATDANSLNDERQVVGSSAVSNGVVQAFRYSDGTMQQLTQRSGGASLANDINNRGDIVGYYAGTIKAQGFVITNGVLKEIPRFPNGSSVGVAINDQGLVLAYGASEERFQSFLWDGELMKDIGTLGHDTFASDLNNFGQVVGRSQIQENGPIHGFLYSEGTMFDLNNVTLNHAGWTIEYATAINDLGRILAQANSKDGLSHAVLLFPIPEPRVISLLSASLAILTLIATVKNKR